MLSESAQISPRSAVGALRTFASNRRLKVRLDECADPVIFGRHGEIGEYGDGRLAASFHGIGPASFSRARASRIRRTLTLSVGDLVSGGRGSDEAVFAFNGSNSAAGDWFVKALGIRRRRSVSPETAERLRQLARGSRTSAGEAVQTPEALERMPRDLRVDADGTGG